MKIVSIKRNFKTRHALSFLSVSALGLAALLFISGGSRDKARLVSEKNITRCCNNQDEHHVCVMKTILGIDTGSEGAHISTFTTTPEVEASMKKGLEWISKAQGNDGGWGAGTHDRQNVLDPHAVKSDPASTSLVAMALLRTDNTAEKGNYSANLKKSIEFLLKTTEECPDNQTYLTTLVNTQPQIKLGQNIDVILTAQFFTNLLRYEIKDEVLKKRVEKALDKCLKRIQKGQDTDGSWKNGGWAPVLQSALANNALENAQDIGRSVDSSVLNRSRKYQNDNFDTSTNSAVTGKAAGVMLYSFSSTTRASAKESRRAKDIVEKAKKEGKIKDDKVTAYNLQAAGVGTTEAKQLVTAYSINQATGEMALREDVMSGFGSNGGEEFMSYLMTGESMVMQGGDSWKKWYDMMTAKLVNIQTQDGSWNGHHCITSPVFCTATCLLILSIHTDMQFSVKKHPK